MSLTDLILFPNIPKELYTEYKQKNKVSVKNLQTISKEIARLFNSSKNGDKLCQSILFDFYISINHPSVFKDNITGKRIEQRLAELFALSTSDIISKENPDIKTLLNSDEITLFSKEVLDLVCSNYREKGDLFFFESGKNSIYKLSIKSLVPENKEINCGAFEFQSTIKDIDGIDELLNLQERKRQVDVYISDTETAKIGLGSSKQMSNIINYLKYKGKLEEYIFRFKILLRGVYKEDILLYIKDNNKFVLYLINNKTFIEIITERILNNFNKIRIEGNAIRISDLTEFKERAFYKFEDNISNVIPNFNEIEKLLIESNHNKLLAFRKFTSLT